MLQNVEEETLGRREPGSSPLAAICNLLDAVGYLALEVISHIKVSSRQEVIIHGKYFLNTTQQFSEEWQRKNGAASFAFWTFTKNENESSRIRADPEM